MYKLKCACAMYPFVSVRPREGRHNCHVALAGFCPAQYLYFRLLYTDMSSSIPSTMVILLSTRIAHALF